MIGQLNALLEQLDALRARAIEELESIETSAELEEWDHKYLGRKRGELTNVSSGMGKLSKGERPVVGHKINVVKAELTERLAARKEALRQREMLQALEKERIDVTLPGRALPVGHMHPISRAIWDITQVFVKMGFHVIDGPEVETDYYNFQALNIPADHPARDMQDTFWVVPGQILLRTQTSPMQIRGMLHPRVLRGVGYDPAKYRGFAFGIGPERVAILRHTIEEIRLFSANDLRFLKQF